MAASDPLLDRRIAEVRRFNRFYTQKIGVLNDGLLRSEYSLTEVRVLYELAQRQDMTASDLGKSLALDTGYLSRMLRSFEQRGLVSRRAADDDARRSLLRLTRKGRAGFGALDRRSQQEIGALLEALPPGEQERVVSAMRSIQSALAAPPAEPASWHLRPPRPGDMGWIVHRHGALYAAEYGWNERFEALVARVVAEFVDRFDAERERCWIAERDGTVVGSVFLVRGARRGAKLRLLLVEPTARGLGIGRRLVEECLRFARAAGYWKVTLWTNDVLTAARRIYEAAGFQLVEEKPHRDFGPPCVGQTWALDLQPASTSSRTPLESPA